MMKTASTYMLDAWSRQAGICLARRGTFSLMEAMRQAVQTGEMASNAEVEISADRPPADGSKVVVGNEGFSTAFLNGPQELQDRTGAYVDFARSMLRQLLPGVQNVLIVVREPQAWIRSIFVQSIKEGGCGSAQSFVYRNQSFLRCSLNLREVHRTYAESFSNVLVLPYELLQRDEPAFWQRIERSFGLVAPRFDGRLLNASPTASDTMLLERMNCASQLVYSSLSQSERYDIAIEREALLKANSEVAHLVNRRFVEYASDRQRQAAKDAYGLLASPCESFMRFELPELLSKTVKEDYVGYLEETGLLEDSLPRDYRANAMAAI